MFTYAVLVNGERVECSQEAAQFIANLSRELQAATDKRPSDD